MPPKATEYDEAGKKALLAKGLGATKNAGLAATGTALDAGCKLGDGYGKVCGTYDRLFLKHINREFGDNLELASRAACFTLICGLPFMTPKWMCPICDHLVRTKFYNSGAVTYFLFTLYKTTGDTIYFAQGGIVGTILAVATIWLMNGFMPGGYRLDGPDSVWWIANAVGVLFVFLLLYLNFDGNTRVFGLSTYVWFWMAYINPHVDGGFSENFQVKVDGAAMSGLVTALSGCSIAIVAAYLPYPLFALWRALETSKVMVEQLHMTWEDFAKYYCGDENNPMATTVLGNELKALKEVSGKLDGYIASAWYECLGMGKWQRQRLMMKRLSQYVSQTSDRLSSMMQVCLEEDFGPTHDDLMVRVRAHITMVIDLNGELLSNIYAAILAGGFSEESAKVVNAEIETLSNAVAALTSAFVTGSQAVGEYKLSDNASGENVVASNVCAFATLTRQFAEEIQSPLPAEVSNWKNGTGAMGIFAPSVLQDKSHLQWTVRNGTSILVAFTIGYNGVAGKMILNYNPAIASTICVLLSNFVGSALTKNLSRLQGVVLGIVVGQVGYALLGWCVWWGYISVAVALYSWTLLALFVYYNSSQYSTVGLLLAVFGSAGLLQGCSEDIFDPRDSFYAIINCTAAIAVMGIVDIVLSPGRASDMARDEYIETFDPLIEALRQICDSNVKELPPRGGKILGQINSAAGLGEEAAQEPRYWRHSWPDAMFTRAISCLHTLRFCISSIEFSSTHMVNGSRMKEDHFISATSLVSFAAVRDALTKQMLFIRAQLEKKMTLETGGDVFLTRLQLKGDSMSTSYGEASKKALSAFMAELNSSAAKRRPPGEKSLEEDPIADMSLFICSLQAIFAELDAIQQYIVA